MIIKPQNLLRFLLLIPYVAWGLALLLMQLMFGPAENPNTLNAFWNALATVAAVYAVGIILWGIPCVLLTIILLLWSIHKPAPVIYKVLLFSPLLLSLFMTIEVVLVSFSPQSPTSVKDFLSYILLVVGSSLAFGYVFVGVGALIYKVIDRLNWMSPKTEPDQAQGM